MYGRECKDNGKCITETAHLAAFIPSPSTLKSRAVLRGEPYRDDPRISGSEYLQVTTQLSTYFVCTEAIVESQSIFQNSTTENSSPRVLHENALKQELTEIQSMK